MNILVTGCSSGVGLEIIKLLKDDKMIKVVGVARTSYCHLDQYLDELLVLDMAKDLSEDDLSVLDRFDFDIVINNAGITKRDKFYDHSISDIKDIMRVNALTPMMLINKTYRKDKEQLFINVLSGAVKEDFRLLSCYSAAKTALDKFSACMYKDILDDDDRLHSIIQYYPGPIDTKLCPEKYKDDAKSGKIVLLGPQEVATKILSDLGLVSIISTNVDIDSKVMVLGE